MTVSDLNDVIGSKNYVAMRVALGATQSLDFTDIQKACEFLSLDPLVLFRKAQRVVDEGLRDGPDE